jgi:hypothetical protein
MDKPIPPRYEIVSPYAQAKTGTTNLYFTKTQFDMRRKVEILKYDRQNSKTNNATKSEIWSGLIKQVAHVKRICKSNPYVATPTTASDVPGPPINLFLDPTVPLYNYINTNQIVLDRSSSINVNVWSQKLFPDVAYVSNVYNTCVVVMYNAYKKGPVIYNFKTPLAINIQGRKNLSSSGTRVSYIDVQISSVKCTPYYGSIPAVLIGTNVVTLPSYNYRLMLPTAGGDFSATKYIGLLNVQNLILYMTYQFSYKLTLTFNISVTLYDVNGNVISGQSDTTLYTREVISNLSSVDIDSYYYNVFNCSFADPSLPAFSTFEMTSSPPNKVDYIPYGSLQS